MGRSGSVYDFNIDGDKWLTTDAGSVLFCMKRDHKIWLQILYEYRHMITFINIETLRNFEVISDKFNLQNTPESVVMKTVHSNASLNYTIIYSLEAWIHAFTIQSEHPLLRKHDIYVSSSSIKREFFIKITTGDVRDHCWQIHLVAELILLAASAFALTISPSTILQVLSYIIKHFRDIRYL
jgi:hypothetical protein